MHIASLSGARGPRAHISTLAPTAFVLVGVVVCACAFAAPAAAAGGCPDYEFLAARGSGETWQPNKDKDKGAGPTIYAVYQDLENDLHGSGLNIPLVPIGSEYKAISVFDGLSTVNGVGAFFHLPGGYNDSVKTIEPWVKTTIIKESKVCSTTKYILSGYSQGAQGMADALQREPAANPGKVLGAAFFGDPYFNPTSPGDWSTFDTLRYGLLGKRPAYSSEWSGKVFSYCHHFDPICQGILSCVVSSPFLINPFNCRPSFFLPPQHFDYAPGDTQRAAGQLAALIRVDQANRGKHISEPSPGPISGPLDVAFAVDSTGSMSGIIDQVKTNVTTIVEQMRNADSDLHVGLVDYKDAPPYSNDPYQARVDTPLTTNYSQFDTAVGALSADGGGDTPESVYTGMMTALGLSWRHGAHKEVITIGDAGGHPTDPVTGYTEQTVVNKALSLDPVAMNALPATPDADATFGPVAAATGGADISSAGDAAAAIEHTIQATQVAPIAVLGGPYAGYANALITLSAGASYSPLGRALRFQWDFNHDGKSDQTTTTPTVSHLFGHYVGVVTLKVIDDHGQSAVAQAHVTAAGNHPAAPKPPTTPTLIAGNGTVTATWRPGGGGPTSVYELVDAAGHPVAFIIPKGAGRQAVRVPGFTNGVAVRIRVIATNPAGSATSPLSNTVTPEGASTAEFVVWKGTDGQLWELKNTRRHWGRSTPPGSGRLASAPTILIRPSGEQDVFWRGTRGGLWELSDTGHWQRPVNLPGAGKLGSSPTAVLDTHGADDVFWKGTDGPLWEISDPGGRWGKSVPHTSSGPLGSAPAVVVLPDGEQDVFWKGTDRRLWEMRWTGSWHHSVNLPGAGKLGSAPAAVVDPNGVEHVFWKGTNGPMWELSDPGGHWGASVPLNSGPLGSAPAAVSHPDGQLDVFWKGTDGRLWEMQYTGSWQKAATLPGAGKLGSQPAAAVGG